MSRSQELCQKQVHIAEGNQHILQSYLRNTRRDGCQVPGGQKQRPGWGLPLDPASGPSREREPDPFNFAGLSISSHRAVEG